MKLLLGRSDHHEVVARDLGSLYVAVNKSKVKEAFETQRGLIDSIVEVVNL